VQGPDDHLPRDPDTEQADRLGPGELQVAFGRARRRAAAVPQAVRAHLAGRSGPDGPQREHRPPPTGA
jgi:hypothetical protein